MSGSDRLMEGVLRIYVALFTAYLLLPLLYMLAAAFNASRIPTLSPWRSFTLGWFAAAWNDQRLWDAVATSIVIGIAVVLLSIVLGLAGALLLTRLRLRGSSLLYGLLVSPVLMPGIVIGLSTAIFWDRAAHVTGSWMLAVAGQSSFVSAYCMLIFIARLQRFDPAVEEAALDLGATPLRVFRTITLPYLAPAMWSAAVLGFVQSLENYNTTLFTIGNDLTLTIYIAGKVRLGVTPVVNAVACAMAAIVIAGGIAYELMRWRERRRTTRRNTMPLAAQAG